MKKYFLLLVLVLWSICGLPQNKYSSRNGTSIYPKAKMRMLNLFINIIYDQTPDRDPQKNETKNPWQPGKPNTVNSNVPAFLKGFMDPDLTGAPLKSVISGFFYESSLGNFICLGDFVIVDVAQSRLTPTNPGSNFGAQDIVRQAIKIINESGGLRTVFGHDSISDYDFMDKGSTGLPKKQMPNGRIDFIQVIFRNTGRIIENGKMVANYGQNNPGEGYASEGLVCMDGKIKIGNKYYENDFHSVQNLGWDNFLSPNKTIVVHEFAHMFLGGNDFHTSGGNHYGTSSACPFMGLQGGWGIIGGYNSSLISCNAYERWRLGWTDSIYNPQHYDISAYGNNGDITREQGEQTLLLRDFVTTGDALRIKFPYVDAGASNQYLWLENHQIGRNGKMDFMHYWNTSDCRDQGTPGIYAYIQVGKDKVESVDYSDIFVNDETDNLKVVSAKGNWDRKLESLTDTLNCVAWRAIVKSESIDQPNPLSGYMDQQTHFFDITGNTKKFTNQSSADYPSIIFKKGETYSNLPYLGDNLEAFTDGSVMDLGSNPPPVNAVTWYVTQSGGNYSTFKKINTRNIYLTGLSIQMTDLKNGSFSIHIRWDDYSVKNNVRWTGNILLKEKLILEKGKTITLDKNYTPNQLDKDSLSGVFAPLTTLTATDSSRIELLQNSKIIIDNGSSFILESSTKLTMEKGSQIILKNRGNLIIKKGAEWINHGGKIINKGKGRIIKGTD
ncbi:MAG: hypothetical protein WCL06_02705 [Bacteroidota bacterium]